MPEAATSTVEGLFQLMLDTAPAERAGVLAAATRGDERLCERVRRLVAAYEHGEDDVNPRAAMLPPETDAQPVRLGRYTIQSVLAEGGTSIVYLARQDVPPRPVALKVIRPHFTSPGTLGRFAAEAEVLARLKHPGLAHVYDAGHASAEFEDGHAEPRAFLAMELIQGLTLAAFARERGLSMNQRVALVADVCDAVHAAHQQGVIHRDLKPANIVVDADGRPKVLDFGAACLAAELMSAAATSDVDVFVGTGPYLSPEQAEAGGDPRQIDTRSDVYSLGVILYELLAGRAPIDVAYVPVQEAARRIRTVPPTPLHDAVPGVARDLSLISAKAIAKSKDDRYQSARGFSDDLRCYLRHEPVSAHPPSMAYELRMLAIRRKWLVTGAAVGAIALIVTTGAAVFQARVATRESHAKSAALAEASAERDDAAASAEFLEGVLTSANPTELGRDVLVRDVLEEAVAGIEEKFRGKPASEARVCEAVGRTYLGLGDLASSRPQLERAYGLWRETNGENGLLTAKCGMALAAVLGVMGEQDQSAAIYSRTLNVFRREYPRGHGAIIEALAGLASVEKDRQKFGASLDLYREAIALAKERGGPLTAADLRNMALYADILQWTGDIAGAQAQYDEVLPLMREKPGKDHPWTVAAENGAATVAALQGRMADAEQLYREVLEVRTRILGPDHGDTLGATNNLAGVLASTGRTDEAEELYQQVIRGAVKVLGPKHRNTLKSQFNLARTVYTAGRLEEAMELLTSTLAAQREALGPKHVDIADSLQMLATINARLGHADAAVDQFHEAIEMLSELLSPDHHVVLQMRSERGACLMQLSRLGEAESELQVAVTGLLGDQSAISAKAQLALERLAACQEAQGHAEDAARTRARMDLGVKAAPGGHS